MISKDQKNRMITNAKARALAGHGTLKLIPAGDRESLEDSFTEEEEQVIFWYNLDLKGTTYVIIEEAEG